MAGINNLRREDASWTMIIYNSTYSAVVGCAGEYKVVVTSRHQVV
jgi:hypothetical protein